MKKIFLSLFAVLISVSLTVSAQQAKKTPAKPVTKLAPPKEVLDRSKMPAPGPAPIINIAEPQFFELSNGLKVYVVEDHKNPIIAYSLQLDYDPILEGEYAGYTNIAGQLLRSGTTHRTKDQIDEEIDFIGAALYTYPSGFYASSLTKHSDKLVTILSDIILNSKFTSEELEKIRKQTLSGLEASKKETSTIATNIRGLVNYGKMHPLGEFETEASVKNITLEKCQDFYSTYWRPNIGYLAIAGDITLAEAKQMMEKYFGSWQRNDVPKTKYPTPQAPATNTVVIVDVPSAVQTNIQVTYPVDVKPNSPDVIKNSVANSILGGGSAARLFKNLRETHGWTYGAYSSIGSSRLISRFYAGAEVKTAVIDSAVSEILSELRKMSQPVEQEELTRQKNAIAGNFARSLEETRTIADFAISTARNNLPKDYYQNYLKNLDAVMIADVEASGKKYFLPENANIIAVGKASELTEKLKKFSKTGTILYYDIEGNLYDPAKKTKPVPAGVTAQSVIDNYIKAIGGTEKLKKVKDVSMSGSFNMQGMEVNADQYMKVPDKALAQMSMQGMVLMKQVYNNGKGLMSGQGQSKEMDANELAEMKATALIFPELYLNDLGTKAELLGIEAISGKDCYKVQLTNSLGSKSTDFYEVASGLKFRSDNEQGSTEYRDYKAVEGVLFPFTAVQSMMGMDVEIKMSQVKINSKLKDSLFDLN